MTKPFKIIDLFAGPGGLGEGFSAFKDADASHPFRISLSVEKEPSAQRTLQLRAFYRQFPEGEAPQAYYDFLSGKLGNNPDALYQDTRYHKQATAAAKEARQFTLGEENRKVNSAISEALGSSTEPWVLIGGPPCQAYSIVGRSRNMGIADYDAIEDHRNFLYKEYLKVISKFQPDIYVLENVKGLLSTKVGGIPIFDEIRRDLECPAKALGTSDKRQKYTLYSLTTHKESFSGDDFKSKDFVVRSEDYGVPQARHRVILIGVKNDLALKSLPLILHPCLLYTSPSPRDRTRSRMPSSA